MATSLLVFMPWVHVLWDFVRNSIKAPGYSLAERYVLPVWLLYPMLYNVLQVSGTISLGGKRLELNLSHLVPTLALLTNLHHLLLNNSKLVVYTKEHPELHLILPLIHEVT